MVTRGICLSEEQIVTNVSNAFTRAIESSTRFGIHDLKLSSTHIYKQVSKGPKMGPNKQLIGLTTESQRVVSEFEVTAILILYGLPR